MYGKIRVIFICVIFFPSHLKKLHSLCRDFDWKSRIVDFSLVSLMKKNTTKQHIQSKFQCRTRKTKQKYIQRSKSKKIYLEIIKIKDFGHIYIFISISRFPHLSLLRNSYKTVMKKFMLFFSSFTMEALLYFDEMQNVNLNVNLLIRAHKLTRTAQNN